MNHIGDTNKMVDTPRTDAHIDGLRRDPEVSGCDRTLNFCRQLERELNAANDRIKRLEEFVEQLTNPKFTRDDLPKEALLQRIKRLEEVGVWQPIETAPTDKTWVIGYDAKDGEVGTIIFDLTGDVDDEDVHYEWTDGMRTLNPTHWMPLPEPPEAKEAKP